MSLTEEERKIIVGLEFEKARKAFAQTAELRKLGYWDTVANRLYYAVFHAVSALLIRDGHKVNTHKGAISAFGLNYIRTGLLPHPFCFAMMPKRRNFAAIYKQNEVICHICFLQNQYRKGIPTRWPTRCQTPYSTSFWRMTAMRVWP